MKQQSGFTLIELIVVVVILGILAATAMPKFLDIRSDAAAAAAKGFEAALNSASVLNVAGCNVTGGVATAGKCVVESAAAATCSDIGLLLNPQSVFTVGVLPVAPAVTTTGTIYFTVAGDAALTTAGTTCAGVYGDGTTAGQAMTFIGQATGA